MSKVMLYDWTRPVRVLSRIYDLGEKSRVAEGGVS